MTSPQNKNIEIIREKCIEANPSILELKFGCEVTHRGEKFIYIESGMAGKHTLYNTRCNAIFVNPLEVSVLGRPLTLADVLLTVGKIKPEIMVATVTSDGVLVKKEFARLICDWKFENDNLNYQSDSTLQFLADLLA